MLDRISFRQEMHITLVWVFRATKTLYRFIMRPVEVQKQKSRVVVINYSNYLGINVVVALDKSN